MASLQTSEAVQPYSWKVSLSPSWNVLGPFPIHAREQHFLSPSYPLDLSDEIDFTKSYTSSLAENGSVSWAKFVADPATGALEASYPDVRWRSVRQTEGWAGLQHHSVLHTVLTILPPTNSNPNVSSTPPRIHVNLKQGSFFTILPKSGGSRIPKWYSGNIYSMERSLPRIIDLPSTLPLTSPTSYDIFVSGDYEIRLFGDPQVYNGNDVPTLTVNLTVQIGSPRQKIEQLPSLDVVPDFVDGWAFGGTIGIFLRNYSRDRWVINGATLADKHEGLNLRLVRRTIIQSSQTRVIPIAVHQSQPFRGASLELIIRAASPSGDGELLLSLPVKQLPHWSSNDSPTSFIKSTYLFSGFTPTAFLVKPPLGSPGTSLAPVVALHGAGVDIFHLPFWRDALPRQGRSWTIIPSGRTSWGLDWHGPSTAEMWHCVDALEKLLKDEELPWASWSMASNTQVVLIGHSNGGQGAWHITGRFPDRVVAAVPAAGYIKSQAYVPLTQSRARRFIDPALNSILESSLTPDDNDVFLSNIVRVPVLAVHGGDDDNVPTWHTRELVSTLKSLDPAANVTLKEDPGQRHWYDSVFDNEVVQNFIRRHTIESTAKFAGGCDLGGVFTLTVAVPAESDTLCGLRIERLSTPGRLGKLRTIKSGQDTIRIDPTNVQQFTLSLGNKSPGIIDLEGQVINVRNGGTFVRFTKDRGDLWKVTYSGDHAADIQPSGRLSLVLSSKGPLLFVIPDEDDLSLSYALRLAHDLDTFHKLDVEILTDTEVSNLLEDGSLGPSNIVVFDGAKKTSFGRRLLGGAKHPFVPPRAYGSGNRGNGVIFLHKHPTHSDAVTIFLQADNETCMEDVLRLFPIRTGVFGPDWMVVGSETAMLGAAGVTGAGLWADNWEYCEASSWTV